MGHNRGRTTKRRQMIVAELTRGEANRRRSTGRKPWEWRLTFGPDGAPLAERALVPVVFVVHDVEAVDQDAA